MCGREYGSAPGRLDRRAHKGMSLEEKCYHVLWVEWGYLMGVNGQPVARARSRIESSRQHRQSRQVEGVRASMFLSSFSPAAGARPPAHSAGTPAAHPGRECRGASATPRPAAVAAHASVFKNVRRLTMRGQEIATCCRESSAIFLQDRHGSGPQRQRGHGGTRPRARR